jgi:hypothetical protein
LISARKKLAPELIIGDFRQVKTPQKNQDGLALQAPYSEVANLISYLIQKVVSNFYFNELPRSNAGGVSTTNCKKGNAASCGEFTPRD